MTANENKLFLGQPAAVRTSENQFESTDLNTLSKLNLKLSLPRQAGIQTSIWVLVCYNIYLCVLDPKVDVNSRSGSHVVETSCNWCSRVTFYFLLNSLEKVKAGG